jgi:hypothetical protein
MQEDYIARHKPKRGIAEKLINFTEDEELSLSLSSAIFSLSNSSSIFNV